MGDSQKTSGHPSSIDLISNTTGLDAVIDGHDHHAINEQFVNNKEGNPVLLTSAGSNFQYVGKLTIDTNGTMHSSLISITNDEVIADSETENYISQLEEELTSQGNYIIGHSDVELSIYDQEGKRIVRKQECNLGDFCADALRAFTDADIAMINGGGIRADIKKGDILFNDLYNTMPFGDMISTGTLNGKQLLDALEYSVAALPAESGTFMQVSGLRFEVNPDIPSPVVKTEMFSHVEKAERRVSNVKILNKQSGEYEYIDLSRQYSLATLDYLIHEQGGNGILKSVIPDSNYYGTDVEILLHYLKDDLGGTIGTQYSEPQGRIIYK